MPAEKDESPELDEREHGKVDVQQAPLPGLEHAADAHQAEKFGDAR